MKINALRSDEIYRKIMSAPLEKKNDIFRYEMMISEGLAENFAVFLFG